MLITGLLTCLTLLVTVCRGFLVPHQHVSDDKASRFADDDSYLYPQLRELFARSARGGRYYRETSNSIQQRLSYSECLVRAVDKQDCGFYGISQRECAERDCCWGQTELPGVPWCYHSNSRSKAECQVETAQRSECGYYGIKAHQCEQERCCWQPSNIPNVPWCYKSQVPVFTGECGRPAHAPDTHMRIVGGNEAEPNTWPWQVSLQADGSHYCGGILIDPYWVVSAAHCQSAFSSKATIKLGMHDKTANEKTVMEVGIDEVINHEKYDKATTDNDIMLIKLNRPVTYTPAISPACLPRLGEPYTVGDQCYTTGWGDLESGGVSPDTLHQVMVPLLDLDTCNKPDMYDGLLTSNMVCAGSKKGGIDSCQGDSGGPLVCHVRGRWQLTGIVSWGHGCAAEFKPGLYTNVANYIDWIEKHMKANK